ncbi:hypothetical protein I2I05_06915 [Hymenobacter sp. BT683]|uniref:Glycosyltransferase RgtA/B/C/D-like domain-containing protein n=1 Tax=Hymenobacter jeongseonensis TaxID=2791027 RepID=A0ABS0IH50_9BACT|nr:hypothetical protein [Hymenobacter jeongseonensis]MBF9237125.1 hypothetical protein [Hymenobacter jeongseonensis]
MALNVGKLPVLLLVVQNLLSLFNIGLVLTCWAYWWTPSARNWGWAVLGLLTFPAQYIYASAVMSEMLLQTAVVALAVSSILFIKRPKYRYFAGVMGALILALLLKPVFYPLTGGLAAIGLLVAWWRKKWKLALLGVVPLLVAGLYMQWNEQRTGYFHFSSIAEINLLHYNAAGVVRQQAGPAAEDAWVKQVLQKANAQPTFALRQQLIRTEATAVLWAHPLVYARQQALGMAAFFLDPGRFDISQFVGLKPPIGGGLLAQARSGGLLQALANLPWGLLVLLAVVLLANVARLALAVRGLLLVRKGGRLMRAGSWLAVGLLLYVATVTGPLGAARFLLPVWPLLLGLALVGLQGPTKGHLSVSQQAAAMRED